METKIEEKKEQKPLEKIELLKEDGSFDLIIPIEVEKKIRWMCQQISTTEWSGTLFYKPEGKYEDDTLVIRCVDFFPMDIGSQSYTEFDMSPDVIGYMAENPELLDCQMGLIHSHNTMATFFSGTDTSTLLEEGKDRNHFVSLIVNNAGTYTAGITRLDHTIAKVTEECSFHTFQDEVVNFEDNSYTKEITQVIWRNLKIIKEGEEESRFLTLENRLKEIREVKAAKVKTVLASTVYAPSKTTPDYEGWRNSANYDEDDAYGYEGYGGYGGYYGKSTPKQLELPFESEKDDKLDMNIIMRTVKQLLTGSIILPNDSKININEWVKTMVPLFDRRFKSMKDFETWSDNYIDFLVWDLDDPNLFKTCDTASIGATQIIKVLKKLPGNKYIDSFIDSLNSYTFQGN